MLNQSQLDRFMAFVSPEPNSGCWIYEGSGSFGYGFFWLNGKNERAHRVSYRHFKGDIPEGLCLDHLCRVRCCVNPDHLEAVTIKENVVRGIMGSGETSPIAKFWRDKTHCPQGHEYTERSTYYNLRGSRECRLCRKERSKIYEEKQKKIRALNPKENGAVTYWRSFTHCKNGHPFEGDNLYITPTGHRGCKSCRIAAKKRYEKRKNRGR